MGKMRITKHYDRNINLGNYQTARVGITLEREIEVKSKAEIKKISNSLLKMCKELVNEELEQLKEETRYGG